MAKIQIDRDRVMIRTSWIERVLLGERTRELPLSSIDSVDPNPPVLDLMVHWVEQGAVWMAGVAPYEGHLIPSTKNPSNTLAINVSDAELGSEQVIVELDEGEPKDLAAQIDHARRSSIPPPLHEAPSHERRSTLRPWAAFANLHTLARAGTWLLGAGALAAVVGGTTALAGMLPGLLVVAVGACFALLGGVALAIVANQPE